MEEGIEKVQRPWIHENIGSAGNEEIWILGWEIFIVDGMPKATCFFCNPNSAPYNIYIHKLRSVIPYSLSSSLLFGDQFDQCSLTNWVVIVRTPPSLPLFMGLTSTLECLVRVLSGAIEPPTRTGVVQYPMAVNSCNHYHQILGYSINHDYSVTFRYPQGVFVQKVFLTLPPCSLWTEGSRQPGP